MAYENPWFRDDLAKVCDISCLLKREDWYIFHHCWHLYKNMFLCPATEMPCNGHIEVVAMAWLCCITVNKEIVYLRQWFFASAYSRKKKKEEKKVLKLMKLTLVQKVIYVSQLAIIHSKKALCMGIGNDRKLS